LWSLTCDVSSCPLIAANVHFNLKVTDKINNKTSYLMQFCWKIYAHTFFVLTLINIKIQLREKLNTTLTRLTVLCQFHFCDIANTDILFSNLCVLASFFGEDEDKKQGNGGKKCRLRFRFILS